MADVHQENATVKARHDWRQFYLFTLSIYQKRANTYSRLHTATFTVSARVYLATTKMKDVHSVAIATLNTERLDFTMATPHTDPMTPSGASASRWDKENSAFDKNQSLDWRNESDSTKTNKALSKGLSARSFHASDSRRRPRPGQQAVQDMHSQVHTSLLKQEKKKVGQRDELQRSAYKQVTSLRTWPLQERAMRHWNDLMKDHLHLAPDDEQDEENDSKSQLAESSQTPSVGDSTSSSSSSSSSSGLSAPEPKRLLRDCVASPAQSHLKAQYRQSFLAEQAVERPVSLADSSMLSNSPKLWCMEPRIFSTEKSGQGKRKYVVGHLGRFLDVYWRKSDRLHRHYYELIKERTPCRLYFDIEFSKLTNPDISDDTAEGLLQEFFTELSQELTERYNPSRPLLYSDIIDLDSSTATKFSRHWIVHMPDQTLFAHAIAAGRFVQDLIGQLANLQATGQLVHHRPLLHKYLFVQAAPSKSNPLEVNDHSQDRTASMAANKTSCFIDLGVYTRNRLFRLMGSSKFGKSASDALRIAKTNEFPFPEGFGNECFYLPSMEEHLRKGQQQGVTIDQGENTHGADVEDELTEAVNKFVASTDWTLHAEALAQTLVVPVNVSKIDFPILPYDDDEKKENNNCGKAKKGSSGATRTSAASPTVGPSPYPVLDNYVLKILAARGGIQGSIRAWSIDSDSQGNPVSIAYQMSRNRWCECVRRAHKSNNIMWTVDFVSWQCIQGCHDPECRGLRFRGTPIDLPADVLEAVRDALFEEQLACLDEQALLEQRKVAPATSLQETIDEDEAFEKALMGLNLDGEKEAFEKALMALDLDGEQPEDQRTESPLQLEAHSNSGEAEDCSKAVSHPSPKAASHLRNVLEDSDSDTDSDEDIVEFAKKLERLKQEQENLQG